MPNQSDRLLVVADFVYFRIQNPVPTTSVIQNSETAQEIIMLIIGTVSLWKL